MWWTALIVWCFVVVATILPDPASSHRQTLYDAKVERQHMIRKYMKKANTEQGKLKLVGGRTDNEGERIQS